MAIPSYDFIERPYDDDYLIYDYNENRYIAKVDAIVQYSYVNLVRDWGTKDNAQSYLDLVSRVIYTVILSFKEQRFRNAMLYYMSHSKSARQTLLEIFSDTVWYNRRDGGFLMAYNSGANLNLGKLIEFGIDKAISSTAKQMVRNTEFGTRRLTIDLNNKETFDDLKSLLEYLVENSYITQDEADVVTESEDLEDLPYHESYDVMELDNDRYLFTDLETLSRAIQDMKKYNTSTGSW